MADEVELVKNCYLINAPAGSGKTTRIKEMINEIVGRDDGSNVLCITFTNRAADELSKDIDSENVIVQTIHSFIHLLMKNYFSHKKIIDLYFEIYENDMINRINNAENDERINKSNQKYQESKGQLDIETLRRNVSKIYYNELAFNSLYSGGLSHDDLLKFTKLAMEKYPKIGQRISRKYNYIFIDEYQDTSANILKIFYGVIDEVETKLFLFGDKMQQIYKNYDGSFEDKLNLFDQSEKLSINYRSEKPIVDVLNNIYNDSNFEQKPDKKNRASLSKVPMVYMCDDIKKAVKMENSKNSGALNLVVFNKERFESAGVGELYSALSNIDKYSFGGKFSATDILTLTTIDNPDDLLKTLFQLDEVYTNYKEKKYGLVIQSMRNRIFNAELFRISKHIDKVELDHIFSSVFDYFDSIIDETIGDWIIKLNEQKILNQEYYNYLFESEEYLKVLTVPLQEFKNLTLYLKNPNVSTQHGVKGEGHAKVFFIAENSGNPSIKIYDFFKLWTTLDLNFTDIQEFYYNISSDFNVFEKQLGLSVSKLNKNTYKENQELIDANISDLLQKHKESYYFREIYLEDYVEYKEKKGLGKAKECFKINKIYGVLSAYKLFYVGCSRAKEELVIFIDNKKLKVDKEKLEEKFRVSGFKVEDYKYLED